MFDKPKPTVGCGASGRRRRGRPSKRWKEEVERDLQVLRVRRCRELVADRKKWKDTVRQAKAHSGLYCQWKKKKKKKKVDLQKFSHEQDIAVGAVKLSVNSLNICILSIYRAPSGNFLHFLDKLEVILNLLYSNNTHLIICGDININYPVENNKKKPFWILYWPPIT